MSENKGDWAVAVRDAETGKGYFVHQAEHVDEQTARKAFGLAIRAIEFGLSVDVDENDSIKASAARLLRWSNDVKVQPIGGTEFTSSGWAIVQEHQDSLIRRFDAQQDQDPSQCLPFIEDVFRPGVPCHPGAWGSYDACAMHRGLPLDERYGMCVEGQQGAKYLGLITVPKAMQTKWNMRQTITKTELQFDRACITVERVVNGQNVSDADFEHLHQVLELAVAKANRKRT